MTDQSTSESLKTIFAERDAVILVLAAVLDDLGELGSKNQLQELVRELQAANSVEDLQSNPLIVQWLPVLASGFNRDSVNNGLTNLIVYASRNHEIQVERRRGSGLSCTTVPQHSVGFYTAYTFRCTGV